MAMCPYCKNDYSSGACPNCGSIMAFGSGTFVFGHSKGQSNVCDLVLTDKYLITKYVNPYKASAGPAVAAVGFGMLGSLAATGIQQATKGSRDKKAIFGLYDLRELQKVIYPCFVGKVTKKPNIIKFINQDGSDFVFIFQPYKDAGVFSDVLRQVGVYVEDGSGMVLQTYCDRPFVDKNTFGTRACHSAGAFVRLNPKQFVVPPMLGGMAQGQSYQEPMQEQPYQFSEQPYNAPMPAPMDQAPVQEQTYQPPMQEQTYEPPVQPEPMYNAPMPEPIDQPPVQEQTYQPPVQEQTYEPPVQPEPQYSAPMPAPMDQSPMQEQTYQPPVQEQSYQPLVQEPMDQSPMQEQAYEPPVQPEPLYSAPMPEPMDQPTVQEQTFQPDPVPVKTVRAFCTNCGTPLKEGLIFCTNCGMKMRYVDEKVEIEEQVKIDEKVEADEQAETDEKNEIDQKAETDESKEIVTDLSWQIKETKPLLYTPVFDVLEQHEVSATGIEGDYDAIDAPDWAMVVAVYQDSFVLVRQWRHAAECLSLEFPGGVVDRGEDAATAARRELCEETGFEAGKLTCLGSVSPNPALFKNRFYVYLAEDLTPTGSQTLDDDELLTYELMPVDEVIASYGKGEFAHALMGTALALYRQHMDKNQS